jgi:hypothetical protein
VNKILCYEEPFGTYVAPGDIARFSTKDGFNFEIELSYDPCLVYRDVVDTFDPEDKHYGKENKKIVDAWVRNEWFYCLLEVRYVNITEKHEKSLIVKGSVLGGVESNFPSEEVSKNKHLNRIAVELAWDSAEDLKFKVTSFLSEVLNTL